MAVLFALALAPVGQVAQAHPMDRVYLAVNTGSIDEETRWRYQIYALYDPAKLPASFQDNRPTRCVTTAFAELRRAYPNLSAANKLLLDSYDPIYNPASRGASVPNNLPAALTTLLNSGTSENYQSGGITYRLVYATSGNDAVGAGYITHLKTAIDDATSKQAQLGYPMPIGDQTDNVYYIFISRAATSDSTYGYVQAGGVLMNNPNSTNVTETDAIPSYMVLHSTLGSDVFGGTTEDNIKLTFAHEHFHSIQNGITSFNSVTEGTGNQSSWLAESTATWMETQVYPDKTNPYPEYMSSIFDPPHLNHFTVSNDGNSTANLRQYGSFLGHKYLEEHGGTGTGANNPANLVIRKVYNDATPGASAQSGKTIAQLFKEAMEGAGVTITSFENLVKEFTVANVLRTASLSGSTAKYTYSKAAAMHCPKGTATFNPSANNPCQASNGGTFTPMGFTFAGTQTFSGTAVNMSANNLEPLGANYFKLTVAQGQTAKAVITSTSGTLSAVSIALSSGVNVEDASSRASLNATVGNEVAIANGGSGTLSNLTAGTYILRVLNTNFSPGSTTTANYAIAVSTDDTPPATPTLASIQVAPATTTLNLAGQVSQSITVTCRDQNNASFTCPTLSWTCFDGANSRADFSNPTATNVTMTASSAGTCSLVAQSGNVSSTAQTITITNQPVTINCNVDGTGNATTPDVGDAAKLLAIISGSDTSTVCAGGACDFDQSGNTTPNTNDFTRLVGIILGNATSTCGNTFTSQ